MKPGPFEESNKIAMPEPCELSPEDERLQARRRMMDLIAIRDHSEAELRTKLKGKFSDQNIELALDYAKEKGWIPANEGGQAELADKTAEALHDKLKGIHFINQSLIQRGLPEIAADPQRELEKARELLETKYPGLAEADASVRSKAARFLISRGFDSETVEDLVPRND